MYEADSWFERNKAYLENYQPEKDEVIQIMKKYGLNPASVLEIGCSAGYRLNSIQQQHEACRVFGLEPSQKAIEYGKERFKEVAFEHGTADNLSAYADGSMDVVIVGFVFYVVDRNIVLKVISEVDRVLKNGGALIIVDFFSETPLKNQYHHITNFPAYSFKQNYDEIFTASRLYYLLDKTTLSHTTRKPDASEDYFNKYSISLLKKDVFASYK